jgi:regulator of protease activity HflC (stomatin/prohibitin superfamily)
MGDFGKILLGLVVSLGFLGGLTYAGCAGYPQYKVWSARKDGEATYARASKDREVKVLEAQAKLDAAKLDAQAEIERAKGVAGANAIIADGLKGNEDYLRYLWIDKVAGNTAREIVYVPTEANLPILEAGKTVAK